MCDLNAIRCPSLKLEFLCLLGKKKNQDILLRIERGHKHPKF